MQESQFKESQFTLIFNEFQTLIAIVSSQNQAAKLTQITAQSILYSCTGKYNSSAGFYFRRLPKGQSIELGDLGNLKIQEYDIRCGYKRTYHTSTAMVKRRKNHIKKVK